MKLLLPMVIALLGLGAGVGAGLALKPAPEEAATAACPEHSETPCATPATAPGAHDAAKPEGELAYAVIDKPFVVPIFRDGKVAAMVVLSLSVEVGHGAEEAAKAAEPRLRDGFLKVMFRHANTGGFDGSFTEGQKMEDLKAALLASAREVMPGTPIGEVLITEIARQDV